MNSLIKGIHSAGISVPDLDRAVAWYEKATGFTEVLRYRIQNDTAADTISGLAGLAASVALIRAPNGFLEFMQFDKPDHLPEEMPVIGPGMTHICFQSPASDPAFSRFESAGMQVINRTGQPVDLGGYGILYTYARDLYGNIFELEHFDSPPRDDSMWLGHVALVSHDIDRLVDFYTGLLGHGPKARGDYQNNARLDEVGGHDNLKTRGAWFKTGNQLLELWQYVHPKTLPAKETRSYTQCGYNKFTFEVDDIAAVYGYLETQNVQLISKPTQWNGTMGFHAHDPDGNRFAVMQWLNNGSEFSIDYMLWDENEARSKA